MGIHHNKKQAKGWKTLTDSNKTRILFDGGSRSGKTLLLIEYMVMRAELFPGSRQLIARKNIVHAKQSIWNDTLKKYLSSYIPRKTYKLSVTELRVDFSNGSSIIVGGLDDAERVEKILGNEYITVYLNEATQLSWETVQMAMTRLAQNAYDKDDHKKAVPKLLLDCNPRGPRHWLHIVGVRNTDPDTGKKLNDHHKWARLSWSAYDNMENLPEEYIRTLESLPDIMRDRMLNGIWRCNEGAVYDEFNEDIHTVEPFSVPDEWKKIRAIDFGFTNPFVCLWGAVDNDDRLYIYREYYKARTRTAEHAQIINELTADEKISFSVADHDAGERAELENSGICTEKAVKNVREGIQAVKNRLYIQGDGKPRLFFFNNLSNIFSEFYDYVWAPEKEGRNNYEEPLKESDHAMDALRYMIMALDRESRKISISSASKSDGRYG